MSAAQIKIRLKMLGGKGERKNENAFCVSGTGHEMISHLLVFKMSTIRFFLPIREKKSFLAPFLKNILHAIDMEK